MKKRQWTFEQKLQIVMHGAGGRAVSEICNEYQIGQSQYYLWRDQFLQNAGKVFEIPKSGESSKPGSNAKTSASKRWSEN